MTPSDAILPAPQLEALAVRALRASGMRAEDAAEVARILVLADLFGLHAHGVRRIPDDLARVKAGGIDVLARPRIDRAGAALLRVDGANGMGPLVMSRALHAAMQAAHGAGVAAAFVRGSNDPGVAMPYGFIAARQGFATILASTGPRRGDGLLGIGVPRPGGDPVILDVPPEGLASGGHGLGPIMALLAGALAGAGPPAGNQAGAAPQDLGHALVVIDTTRLGPAEALAGRIAAFDPKGTNTEGPSSLPGERALALHHDRMAQGVPVAAEDLARLHELAG